MIISDGFIAESDPRLHGIFQKLYALNICDQGLCDLYAEGFADFWDAYSSDLAVDIAMFEKLLPAHGGRVLDLACGSGRIGIGLAKAGARVDGLELSQAMLDRVEENLMHQPAAIRERLAFFRGDMCDFSIPHRYDLIVLGATSISLLLEHGQRHALFTRIREHLAEGGKFAFDIWDLGNDRWRAHHGKLDVYAKEKEDGQEFALVGQLFDLEKRRFMLNVYREFIAWDGETTRTMACSAKAWLEANDMPAALSAAGLSLLESKQVGETMMFVAGAAQ